MQIFHSNGKKMFDTEKNIRSNIKNDILDYYSIFIEGKEYKKTGLKNTDGEFIYSYDGKTGISLEYYNL